ncbi:MAG: hypothetical protein ACK42C_05530 [Aquificaceae bacterium]
MTSWQLNRAFLYPGRVGKSVHTAGRAPLPAIVIVPYDRMTIRPYVWLYGFTAVWRMLLSVERQGFELDNNTLKPA